MAKCWRFQGLNNNGTVSFEHYACGNDAYYQSIPGHPQNGANLVVDGVIQNGSTYVYWGPPYAQRTLEEMPGVTTRQGSSTGNCDGCENTSLQPHDCINGACLLASQYGTPGLYASLAECEVACGTGCSGKCISNAEWSQIESLSNQLKNKNCG
jgi:hypothetical protein